MVAHKDKSQEVKNVVKALVAAEVEEAENSLKDYRPWGWFERLINGDRFQVKRIFVNPGASLSLQSHKYRSEHWIVVQGAAKVTVDKNVSLLHEGQSVYVPLGSLHRLENPGETPMVLIEIQTGEYLGEDDIVRYDDRYSRV